MSATNLIAEQQNMGRVLTEATIENLRDLWAAEERRMPPEDVRRLQLSDALVDTGATTLALPSRYIFELGLAKVREQNAVSSHGRRVVTIYEAVRLTLLGRSCIVEVMEVPDEVPALIGQIPLEMLDLVVDLQGRRLTGNPAHGGEHVLELCNKYLTSNPSFICR
jgi:predicted aspartyl protease